MAALTITRGTTKKYLLTARQADGSPLDLTGKTVWLTVKATAPSASNVDLDDASAVIKAYWVSGGASALLSVPTPSTGAMTLALPASLTTTLAPGHYFYDVKIKFATDDIRVWDSGTFDVAADITRRTTAP